MQKTEKCYIQRFRTFAFDLKVSSKPIFKKLSMTNFGFKQFLTLFLTFPGITFFNSFNFVAQKFVNIWKMWFSKVQNIQDFRVASKAFSKMLSLHNFGFTQFWTLSLTFPKKNSTSSIQNLEKREKCRCQTLKTFVFYLKKVLKLYSKKLPRLNLDLRSFWQFLSLFQKIVSTSLLKKF